MSGPSVFTRPGLAIGLGIAEFGPGELLSLKKLQQLLPQGLAWTTDADADLTALAEGLSYEFDRVETDADKLLVESNPATTDQLLSDWEDFIGLPGVGPVFDTVVDRQAALAAKIGLDPEQRVAYFTALATGLGYTITVTTFTSPLCTCPCNAILSAPPWCFCFEVTTPSGAQDAVLKAVLNDATQSHTFIIFTFT